MANKLYREEDVRAVADAIRAKNESTETYTLSEMADAILAIESGGSVSAPLIVHSLANYINGEFSPGLHLNNWESVTIATSIMHDAFSGSYSLKSVTIAEGVTSIGANAFTSCNSLTSITIPSSVTSIDNNAFSWCPSLTSIIIPEGVESIGAGAFRGCESLMSVTIPRSITSLGGNLFISCNALTEINYNGTIAEWQALDTYGLVDWGKTVTVHCTDGDTTASQSGD